jgi:hypothetical protein
MRQFRLETSANKIHTFWGRLENGPLCSSLLIPVSPPVGAAGVPAFRMEVNNEHALRIIGIRVWLKNETPSKPNAEFTASA